MHYQNTLEQQLNYLNNDMTLIKKPAVSSSLQSYLERQSSRINQLINKKKLQQSRLSKISAESISYRENLKDKIDESQKKHQKDRSQFLNKRVKSEKFRISEVQRKRGQLKKSVRSVKKGNEERFKNNIKETIKYWKEKEEQIQSDYLRKTFSTPLYSVALNRKNSLEQISVEIGDRVKDRLLIKHNTIRQKMGYLVTQQQKNFDQHKEQITQNLLRNKQIMDDQQAKLTNKIGESQQKRNSLQKARRKQWQQKLKYKLIDQDENFTKIKQKYKEISTKRTNSMKNCRQLKKTREIEAGMTTSTFFPHRKVESALNNNQEDIKIQKNNKLDEEKAYKTSNNFSVMLQRNQFMESSKILKVKVGRNKSILRSQQEHHDERKIMNEQEITEAIKERNRIKNESNMMVRKARIEV